MREYMQWLFSDRGMSQRGSGIVFYGFMWLWMVGGNIAIAVWLRGSPLVWLGLGMTAPLTLVVTMALWCEVTD